MRRASTAYDSERTPVAGEPESMFKLRGSGPHEHPRLFEEQSNPALVNDESDPLIVPTRTPRQRVVRLVAALAIVGTLLALAYVLRTNAAARRAVADWITIGVAGRFASPAPPK